MRISQLATACLRALAAWGTLVAVRVAPPPPPRRATDHSRWFETNISYRIPYEEGFEPYVLVQRRFVPWYDERFKGYRKNKVGWGRGRRWGRVGGSGSRAHRGAQVGTGLGLGEGLFVVPQRLEALPSVVWWAAHATVCAVTTRSSAPSPWAQVVHLMHMFRLGLEFASTPHGYVVHSPHPVANSWNTTQATGFWYKVGACLPAGQAAQWGGQPSGHACTCA